MEEYDKKKEISYFIPGRALRFLLTNSHKNLNKTHHTNVIQNGSNVFQSEGINLQLKELTT